MQAAESVCEFPRFSLWFLFSASHRLMMLSRTAISSGEPNLLFHVDQDAAGLHQGANPLHISQNPSSIP